MASQLMKTFSRSEVVFHLVATKRPWRMIMAIEARMRKNLKRGGTRDQKIRRRSIAAVSSARAAVVMGMYMRFVGYPVSTGGCNGRSDLIYRGARSRCFWRRREE